MIDNDNDNKKKKMSALNLIQKFKFDLTNEAKITQLTLWLPLVQLHFLMIILYLIQLA